MRDPLIAEVFGMAREPDTSPVQTSLSVAPGVKQKTYGILDSTEKLSRRVWQRTIRCTGLHDLRFGGELEAIWES